MKKRLISLFLVLALSISLTGCSKPASGGDDSSSGVKKDVLNLRLSGEVSTFDPAFGMSSTDIAVMKSIYDTLYIIYPDHSFEPSLAESYEVSEDNLTYTFNLKKGVKFHNGEEVKASDVVFTVNRALDSAWQFSTVEQVEKATVISDYVVAIKLKNVYAPFFEVINGLQILNEKAVTEAGDKYGEAPVGTGPYTLVSYENASVLKLTRFDDYFRGPARIKDIVYTVIVDSNTANISLESGETDFGGFTAAALENMKSKENIVVEELPSYNLRYLCMNVEKAPFDNKLVRQAVNYALDREFIVNAAENGAGKATSRVMDEFVFGYSDKVTEYEYNIEKAKALLKEAGIVTPLKIDAIKTIDGAFKKVAEVVQANLADIGIIADIEMLEQNKFLEDAMSGGFTLASFGASPGVDADNYSLFFTPENMNGGYNMSRYNNPVVNELFIKGKTTLDPAERIKIYEECFQIIQDEAVIAPVYYPKSLAAYNKNLKIDNVMKSIEPYTMSW